MLFQKKFGIRTEGVHIHSSFDPFVFHFLFSQVYFVPYTLISFRIFLIIFLFYQVHFIHTCTKVYTQLLRNNKRFSLHSTVECLLYRVSGLFLHWRFILLEPRVLLIRYALRLFWDLQILSFTWRPICVMLLLLIYIYNRNVNNMIILYSFHLNWTISKYFPLHMLDKILPLFSMI